MGTLLEQCATPRELHGESPLQALGLASSLPHISHSKIVESCSGGLAVAGERVDSSLPALSTKCFAKGIMRRPTNPNDYEHKPSVEPFYLCIRHRRRKPRLLPSD